jgi:hypothetical protein
VLGEKPVHFTAPVLQAGARSVSQPSAPGFWLLLADDENSLSQARTLMNQIRQTGRNYDSDAKVERLIRHWRLQTSIVGDRWLMPYQRECRQSEGCR